MTSRVVVSYLLGVALALALVNVGQAQTDSGTQIDIEMETPDDSKYNQVVEVILEAGKTMIKACQELLGYSDDDKECCYVDDVKYQNGEMWVKDGHDCVCNSGQVECSFDDITVPTVSG